MSGRSGSSGLAVVSAVLVAGAVLVFGLLRAVFFLSNRPAFASLDAADLATAFLHGARFDLAAVCLLLGVPLLIANAPGLWRRRPAWARAVLYLPLAPLWAAWLVFLADLHFYPETGRRLSYEVFVLRSDPGAVAGMALAYPGTWAAFALLGGGSVLAWDRTLRRLLAAARAGGSRGREWAAFLACAAVLVVGFRGGLQSKPLRPGHAFRAGAPALGQLTLNPVFTVYHALKQGPAETIRHFPPEQALATVQRMLEGDESRFSLARFPLVRLSQARARAAARPPNVVVFVLEGWPARYVGALGGRPGITDTFDRLAGQGTLFTEFYAVGHRSMDGIAAVGCSLPTFADLRPIGGALEQNTLMCAGTAFRQAGYATLFLHGAKTGSLGLDAFSRIMGFERYMGREDFRPRPDQVDGVWGVYDEPALERANEEFRRMREPFLAFWFSLTSHSPYRLPSERFRVTPSSVPDHDLLDTLRYSDYSLGTFFERASKEAYFRDTVFVLVSDHTSGTVLRGTRERYRIPCLLFDPRRPALLRRDEVAGHLDLLPTLLEVAGLRTAHHSLGRSLVGAQPSPRRVFVDLGSHYGWFRGDTLMIGDPQGPVGLYRFGADPYESRNLLADLPAEAETSRTELYSFVQTARSLLKENRLFPGRLAPEERRKLER